MHKEAGTESTWTFDKQRNPDMRFPVTLAQLKSETLKVDTFDDNALSADTLIGSAEVKLSGQLVPVEEVNEVVSVELELEQLDAKGKSTGHVTVTIERETSNCTAAATAAAAAAPEPTLTTEPAPAAPVVVEEKDPNKPQHKLFVKQVTVAHLKNVEENDVRQKRPVREARLR